MKLITPEIYHVAQSTLDPEGLGAYLQEVGAEEWETDTVVSGEKLAEVAGRLCYRSFKEGLNENVQKIRKGNRKYLRNILDQKHGSVLEHVTDTYIMHNVSRVFTHELVRHRPGIAFSQESLRYVRLTELKAWFPKTFASHKSAGLLESWFKDTYERLEQVQQLFTAELKLDDQGFGLKKKLTSAMRRLAPIGLATSIMVTANHRMWRHMIQQRTSRHAEEEIRIVFGMIFRDLRERYPSFYQDGKYDMVDDLMEVTFENEKI